MKVCVLDLGTNTFNLLVADIKGKSFEVLAQDKIGVRIGENGFGKKIITKEAMERGLLGFESLLNQAKHHGAEKYIALATSALRDADNAKEFLALVREKFQVEIEIITGRQEAEFIYRGVALSGVLMATSPSLIMDIGGGSTQFVIGNSEELIWLESTSLGAARLKELFKPSDPIKDEELAQIQSYIQTHLIELQRAITENKTQQLVGSSGSFDSLVDMLSYPEKQSTKGTYNPIKYQDLISLLDKLIYSTKEERLAMKGLITLRVDFIVLASILIKEVLKITQIREISQCAYSLKEGALFHKN